MEIQELLFEALTESNENKRLDALIKASKRINQQLPFNHILYILAKHDKILKYLIIGSVIFEKPLMLILQALQDRYQTEERFIKLYFDSTVLIIIEQENYSQFVQFKMEQVKGFVLLNTKLLITAFKPFHEENSRVVNMVISFYKQFIQFNGGDFDMLNKCFTEALQIRDKWQLMKDADPFFEHDIEEFLVAVNGNQVSDSEFVKEEVRIKTRPQSGLSKQELKLQMIEDWLFTPCETPLVSGGLAPLEQISSEIFKSKFNLEALITFLLMPTKYNQVSKFVILLYYKLKTKKNVKFDEPQIPTFRQKVRIPTDDKIHMVLFRSFRAMQALTDVRNHFLITQVNQNYFPQACIIFQKIIIIQVQIIYESLKEDQVAITICPDLVIQYIQFLLYYETDIAVYFMLYYNLPFRFMIYFDIAAVSQFMFQFIKSLNTSPYYKMATDQTEIIWKYLDATEYFIDLGKMTMLDQNTIDSVIGYKSTNNYRPQSLTGVLIKPNFTPIQFEKNLPIAEQKRIAEEIENITQDIDLVIEIVKGKQLKAVKIFQRMIDNSILQQQIQDRKSQKKLSVNSIRKQHTLQISPMRRQTVMTPKLATLFEKTPTTLNFQLKPVPLNRGINIFSILENTIQDKQQMPFTELTQPIFQRIMTKKPSQVIHYHARTSSTVRNISRQGSQIATTPGKGTIATTPGKQQITNITQTDASQGILRRFNHLIYSMTERVDFQIYPPELKDIQISELEFSALDPLFEKRCNQNELYTRGVMDFFYDIILNLCQSTQSLPTDIKNRQIKWKMITKNNEEFLQFISKNYFLKLKSKNEHSTGLVAAKIYNFLIKKNPIINYQFLNFNQDYKVLIKILTIILSNQEITPKNLLFFETLALILESTKQKYLLDTSTPFWHCLLEAYAALHHNQLFFNIFIRIMTIVFIYGSPIVMNRILLKINGLQYFKGSIPKIKLIVITLFTSLNFKGGEFTIIRRQINLLSTWQRMLEHFKPEIKLIESGSFNQLMSCLKQDEQLYYRGFLKSRYQ